MLFSEHIRLVNIRAVMQRENLWIARRGIGKGCIVEQLELIARRIFQQFGADFAAAKRAGGWTNATWLCDGMALRLSTTQGNDKIRREVALAKLLPEEICYPHNIATGVEAGLEWSLSKEIPGTNLEEAWPGLDWDQRCSAVRQIVDKVRAVHSVDAGKVKHLARTTAWYNSSDATEASASTERLVRQGHLTEAQGGELRLALGRFWRALPQAAIVLNHGDITTGNMMWHEDRLVSLMDFEYAVMAPAELDWNSIAKFAFGPICNANDDRANRLRLQQTVLELLQPELAHEGGGDLLLGYAILLDQFIFELWLAHPDGEGPMEQWEPYRRLQSLADGRGGYLAPLLAQ